MEAVSAVVEAAVSSAWVDTVSVRRVRRVRLNPVAAQNRKGQQSQGRAGSKQQRQVRDRLNPAPP
jgi:hypothetical protein